jgi:hypothetical protein
MWAAFVFVAAAGVSLFLLSEQTSAFFAWTIKPPITAAFLGCGYLAVATALALGLRDSDWALVRVGVWVVATGLVSILIATLLHLDKFHLHSPVWTAKAWAWSWLFLYVALVPGLLAALWSQWRQPAAAPTSGTALPAGLRVLQWLLGGLMAVMGAALFLAPWSAEQIWPWSLTPLTARMVGSFYLAFGVSLFAAARENDYTRIRIASFAYVVFAILQLATALRYPVVDWRALPGLLLATVLLALFAIGSIGVRGALKARHRRVQTGP